MEKQPLADRLKKVVDSGLCMGCGFCSFSAADLQPLPKPEFDADADSFAPPTARYPRLDADAVVCVGDELDLPLLSQKRYGQLPTDPMLGVFKKTGVAWATDSNVRQKAASGGLIPAVLKYLFDSKKIDVAYCVDAGGEIMSARGRIIRSADELDQIHGSVYHPANYGHGLQELFSSGQRFALVGLPCHLSALETLKLRNESVAKNHVLSIGLFCGGINTFKGISYYLQSFDVAWNQIKQIEYRVGDWPGKIQLTLKDGVQKLIPRIRGNSRWKILRYVIAFQGYWMIRRCRICPDQVADFADIAVGDPHHPKYRQRKESGFSAVVTRSQLGQDLIDEMKREKRIEWEDVEADFIKETQGYTLDNRRHVFSYLKINRWLGKRNPNFKVYPAFENHASARHYIAAAVDLMKIQFRNVVWLRPFYLPWQIFEYLFLTFAPRLIIQRLIKIVSNR